MVASPKSSDPGFIGDRNEAFSRAMGLSSTVKLEGIGVCRRFTRQQCPPGFGQKLIDEIWEGMIDRWNERTPPDEESPETWREEHMLYIDPGNEGAETVLQKSIASVSAQNGLPYHLYNEVPTCSGFTSSARNRKSNVDLMRVEDDFVELIELKWESDTPLHALVQVLHYGMALFFARQNDMLQAMHGHRGAMSVPRVVLSVLGPREFFAKCDAGAGAAWDSDPRSLASLCDCGPYAREMLRGLDALRHDLPDLPEVSIRFRAFQPGFKCPFASGAEVRSLQGGQMEAEARKLRDAVKSIGTIWEV